MPIGSQGGKGEKQFELVNREQQELHHTDIMDNNNTTRCDGRRASNRSRWRTGGWDRCSAEDGENGDCGGGGGGDGGGGGGLCSRWWLVAVLGVVLVLLGVIAAGVYVHVTILTASVQHTQVLLPAYVLVVAVLLTGILVLVMWWKKSLTLVWLTMLVSISLVVVCGGCGILLVSHVLWPMMHFVQCRSDLDLEQCSCLSPFTRNGLSLSYSTDSVAVYLYKGVEDCDQVLVELCHLVWGQVAVYLTVAVICAVVAVFLCRFLCRRYASSVSLTGQSECYEDIFTVNNNHTNSQHQQLDNNRPRRSQPGEGSETSTTTATTTTLTPAITSTSSMTTTTTTQQNRPTTCAPATTSALQQPHQQEDQQQQHTALDSATYIYSPCDIPLDYRQACKTLPRSRSFSSHNHYQVSSAERSLPHHHLDEYYSYNDSYYYYYPYHDGDLNTTRNPATTSISSPPSPSWTTGHSLGHGTPGSAAKNSSHHNLDRDLDVDEGRPGIGGRHQRAGSLRRAGDSSSVSSSLARNERKLRRRRRALTLGQLDREHLSLIMSLQLRFLRESEAEQRSQMSMARLERQEDSEREERVMSRSTPNTPKPTVHPLAHAAAPPPPVAGLEIPTFASSSPSSPSLPSLSTCNPRTRSPAAGCISQQQVKGHQRQQEEESVYVTMHAGTRNSDTIVATRTVNPITAKPTLKPSMTVPPGSSDLSTELQQQHRRVSSSYENIENLTTANFDTSGSSSRSGSFFDSGIPTEPMYANEQSSSAMQIQTGTHHRSRYRHCDETLERPPRPKSYINAVEGVQSSPSKTMDNCRNSTSSSSSLEEPFSVNGNTDNDDDDDGGETGTGIMVVSGNAVGREDASHHGSHNFHSSCLKSTKEHHRRHQHQHQHNSRIVTTTQSFPIQGHVQGQCQGIPRNNQDDLRTSSSIVNSRSSSPFSFLPTPAHIEIEAGQVRSAGSSRRRRREEGEGNEESEGEGPSSRSRSGTRRSDVVDGRGWAPSLLSSENRDREQWGQQQYGPVRNRTRGGRSRSEVVEGRGRASSLSSLLSEDRDRDRQQQEQRRHFAAERENAETVDQSVFLPGREKIVNCSGSSSGGGRRSYSSNSRPTALAASRSMSLPRHLNTHNTNNYHPHHQHHNNCQPNQQHRSAFHKVPQSPPSRSTLPLVRPPPYHHHQHQKHHQHQSLSPCDTDLDDLDPPPSQWRPTLTPSNLSVGSGQRQQKWPQQREQRQQQARWAQHDGGRTRNRSLTSSFDASTDYASSSSSLPSYYYQHDYTTSTSSLPLYDNLTTTTSTILTSDFDDQDLYKQIWKVKGDEYRCRAMTKATTTSIATTTTTAAQNAKSLSAASSSDSVGQEFRQGQGRGQQQLCKDSSRYQGDQNPVNTISGTSNGQFHHLTTTTNTTSTSSLISNDPRQCLSRSPTIVSPSSAVPSPGCGMTNSSNCSNGHAFVQCLPGSTDNGQSEAVVLDNGINNDDESYYENCPPTHHHHCCPNPHPSNAFFRSLPGDGHDPEYVNSTHLSPGSKVTKPHRCQGQDHELTLVRPFPSSSSPSGTIGFVSSSAAVISPSSRVGLARDYENVDRLDDEYEQEVISDPETAETLF